MPEYAAPTSVQLFALLVLVFVVGFWAGAAAVNVVLERKKKKMLDAYAAAGHVGRPADHTDLANVGSESQDYGVPIQVEYGKNRVSGKVQGHSVSSLSKRKAQKGSKS